VGPDFRRDDGRWEGKLVSTVHPLFTPLQQAYPPLSNLNEVAKMPGGVVLAVVVLLGFVAWGAVLFWRGRVVDQKAVHDDRHETRAERRRLHHKT